MFLLIPQEQKNKLLKQYRLRLLFIVISFLAIIGSLGVAALFPAYLYVHSEEEAVLQQEKILNESISDKANENLEKILKDTYQNIEALKGEDQDILSVFNFIITNKPVGVYLTKFNYVYKAGDVSDMEVSGVAKDRESLLRFSNKLKQNSIFSTVDLPISNLAKNTNIDFSISLTGKF